MLKTYLIVSLMGQIVRVIGPMNMSLSECTARVELIVNFWQLDPPLYGIPKGSKLQCVQKEHRRV